MKSKIIIIAIILFMIVFWVVSEIGLNEKRQMEQQIAVKQELIINESNCEQYAKKFVDDRGLTKIGLEYDFVYKFNKKMNACVLSILLQTKTGGAEDEIQYSYGLFDLTNNNDIAIFKGMSHGPKENPHVETCKIYGSSEYTCKDVWEYKGFVYNVLNQ